MWTEVSTPAINSPNKMSALVVQAVNNIIEIHQKRLRMGLHTRIQAGIWLALFAISFLTMMVIGVQTGLQNKRHMIAILPLSLTFTVLVTLVLDLNQPQNGMIKVSQDGMVELSNTLNNK